MVFNDALPNQTYEITVTIRNITQHARKIRVFVPITPHFLVKYDPKIVSLASGLSMRLTIEFDAKEK